MIFSFKNKKTEEYFEKEFRNNEEKETYLGENEDIVQILSKVRLVSPYSVGRRKTDSDFRQVMNHMAKNNPGSTIGRQNLTQI